MVKCVLADVVHLVNPQGTKLRLPYGSRFDATFVGYPGERMPNGEVATRWTFWDYFNPDDAFILGEDQVSVVLLTHSTKPDVRTALLAAEEGHRVTFKVME